MNTLYMYINSFLCNCFDPTLIVEQKSVFYFIYCIIESFNKICLYTEFFSFR